MRPKLIVASIYIAAYEVLKSTIVERLKSFYTFGGIYKEYHRKYKSEVLSRNRSPVYASPDWLKESHAIDDSDMAAFAESKEVSKRSRPRNDRNVDGRVAP